MLEIKAKIEAGKAFVLQHKSFSACAGSDIFIFGAVSVFVFAQGPAGR